MRFKTLLGFILVFIFFSLGISHGAVIEVTTLNDVADAGVCGSITFATLPGADGEVSLREAICASDNEPGEHTIRFRDGLTGTLQLTSTLPTPDKALTIIGASQEGPTIDGVDTFRIFDFNNNLAPITIIGIHFTNGKAVGGIGGGAIRHVGDLTLINCRVSDSQSQDNGGGILNHGFGTLRLEDCLIDDNIVTAESRGGGGVASTAGGPIIAIRTRFEGNDVTGLNLANGGGLLAKGSSPVELRECVFGRNTVTGHGGGLHFSSLEPDRVLSVVNSTFHSNTATGDIIGDGGGLVVNGPGFFTNTTIFANRCDRNGGGVLVTAGLARFTNCTISRNVCNFDNLFTGDGGGVAHAGGQVELRNTLIAQNESTGGATPDISGVITSNGHNFIGNLGSTVFSSNTTGDIYGDPNATTTGNAGAIPYAAAVDPRLAPLQDNGGAVPTQALMPNSLAVNAGDNAFVTPPATDARGAGFDRIIGAAVDIGAFESDGVTIPVILVNTSFDHYDYNFYGFQQMTLREAIALAPAGSIIEYPASSASLLGTTNIRIGASSSINAPLAINRDLIIRGPGANIVRINAEDAHGVITISGSAQVEISGFGIVNGLTLGDGGGINITDTASLTIKECEIVNCRSATDGGGISNSGSGALTVMDCLIDSCRATGSGADGGGIANEGAGAPLTIIRSTIRNCQTTGGMGSSGAGVEHIANGALFTLRDSIIAYNFAEGVGGGLFIQFGDAVISGSAIYGNTTLQTNTGGGGLLIASPSTVTITNSTISGNKAKDFGGGLRISGDNVDVTLTNVTIANNIADDENNSVGDGGGVHQVDAGTIRLRNTLIAGNIDRSGQTPDINFSGTIISDGHNLIGNVGATNFAANTTGDQYGDPQNTTAPNHGASESPSAIDAMLSPLQNNGGLSPTHALQSGSPAIDAGDNTFIASPLFDGPPFFDQRGDGFERIRDGNSDGEAIVDIGAFDSPGFSMPFVVSSLDDGDDGNYLPGFLTLREAIMLTPPFGYIDFDPDLEGDIIVNQQLVFGKNVGVRGPGADVISVRGVGNVRCAYIDTGISVTIEKLTFEQGNSSQGGAIHNRGNLGLYQCAFLNNQSITYGGAIYNRNIVNIVNCYFEGNQTTGDSNNSGGGAIANYDNGAGVSLYILGSTFNDNIANSSLGGGIFNFGDGAGDGAFLFLDNCTITNCHAGAGGGVFNRGSDANITANHDTIVKCSALGGAGLFNDTGAGLVDLTNCLFADNTSFDNLDVTNNVTANYCLFEYASTTVTGANNIFGQDPQLLPLEINGGPWPTHAVLPQSPAVDTGSPDDVFNIDGRGMARPIDGDGNSAAVTDIGAFEYAPFLFVAGDVGDDSNSGTAWTEGAGLEGPTRTIERALDLATYGSEVWIKRGTYQPVGFRRVGSGLSSTFGPLIVKSGVALRGGFEGTEVPGAMLPPFNPNLTVIDGSIAFDGNPAWHVIVLHTTQDVGIYDLTVTGGAAFGHPLVGGTAGAGIIILNSTSSRGINNCVIRGNRALNLGGGVAIGENCVFLLENCTISDNESGTTGAGGLGVFDADVDVIGCTISGNKTAGDGGGLWSRRGRVNILNSTISGNRAGRHGGGIMVFEGAADVKLNFTTITNNTAGASDLGGNGGGVFYDHVGALTLSNSIIAGNTSLGGQTPDMAASGAASQGYNLIGDLGLAGFGNNTTGDQYGDTKGTATPAAGAQETNGILNPMLGFLGAFGGPTATHVPFTGSPVIDAADPMSLIVTDQRGQPRPFDGDGAGGARHDIGAVERQSADDYSPATYYYIY